MIVDGVIKGNVNKDGKIIGIDNFEVARTIGVASSDNGTLCTSKNVNKWSKFKPLGSTTTKEIPHDEYKNYKENPTDITKPFGIERQVAYVSEYNATISDDVGETNIDKLNQLSEWKYSSQPVIDDTTILGYINGKPIYACKHGYRCRLSDFNGYYHAAEPLFKVEWSIDKVGTNGVTAKVTIANNDNSISLSDMGIFDYNLCLIAMSVNVFDITGKSTPQRRYLLGGSPKKNFRLDAKRLDGSAFEYTFQLSEFYLSQILDDMILFFVVTKDRPTAYEIPDTDSWEDGSMVFFPRQTANIETAYAVENSAFFVESKGGIGNILRWNNRSGKEYDSENGTYADKTYSTLEGNVSAFDNYMATTSGFKIKITRKGYEDTKSRFRKLYICNGNTDTIPHGYLNVITSNNGDDGISKGTYYKPLLKDLPVNGTSYKSVSFYIKFEKKSSGAGYPEKKQLIARFVSASNTVKEVIIHDGTYNNSDLYYYSISFANKINARNRVSGFQVELVLADSYTPTSNRPDKLFAKTITFDSWNLDNIGDSDHPYFTTLNVETDVNDNITILDYGDVSFGAVDGLSNVYTNGQFALSYEAIAHDEESIILKNKK